MTGPFQILIISADPQLAPECEAALASLPGEAAVVHRVADARQAVETARNRHPNLAVIEMGRDLARLRAVVADVAAVSPDTLSVAAFRPELFDHEVSESAMLIEALRSGIRDFLRRPVSAVDLGQLVERLSRRDARGPVRWGKLVSFISNKGGVGKSTLAVNTARRTRLAVSRARAADRYVAADGCLCRDARSQPDSDFDRCRPRT